jgi:hypothetical protein
MRKPWLASRAITEEWQKARDALRGGEPGEPAAVSRMR